jgi:hypothetical protein
METSYSNKPYVFVPLADKALRRKQLDQRFLLSSGTRAGKLNVTVECMTPLHFGSGKLEFDEGAHRFVYSLLRESGKTALPGSSFKGMLRSVFEAVTASCIINAPRALMDRIGGLSPCTSASGLCPACSVFGRLSYKGKLIVSSFYTDAEPIRLAIPMLERPFKTYPRPTDSKKDPYTGNERLYYGDFENIHGTDVARMSKNDFLDRKKAKPDSGGNFYGRKFYKHSTKWNVLSEQAGRELYECLPVGAVLSGTVTYQGLTDDELGGLLFALGLGWEKPIYHKLGYAKPAYLGSVRLSVKPESLPRYDPAAMTAEAAEEMASQHYSKHKQSIENAVAALMGAWSEIGSSMWVKQDDGRGGGDRYGY